MKKKTKKKKHSKKSPSFVTISLALISLFIAVVTTYKIVENIIKEHNSFPKMEIFLKDVPVEQLNAGSKDTKYPNNTVIFSSGNKTTTFEDVEIKGRGNLTWVQAKKPYQIKLSEKSQFFNHGEAKKWILLANYLDSTHLRNDIALYLENLLNPENSIGGNFLELYIDDSYNGLYYLSEKIEIQEHRINLKEPSGAVFELDNLHTADVNCQAHNYNGDCFIIKDIVNSDLTTDSASNFTQKINQLETATAQKDFATINELIDVDSFAEYFLLNEFSNNPDGFISSFYLSVDGENDKIHAGPGWDFDLAFGNKVWSVEGVDEEVFLSPYNDLSFKSLPPHDSNNPDADSRQQMRNPSFFYDLLDVPEFISRVKEIYKTTLSGKKDGLLKYIQSQADYIRPAVSRDQARWKLKANFDEEVEYLIDWITKRYDHFETTYGQSSVSPEAN